jgi:hypothetical protein
VCLAINALNPFKQAVRVMNGALEDCSYVLSFQPINGRLTTLDAEPLQSPHVFVVNGTHRAKRRHDNVDLGLYNSPYQMFFQYAACIASDVLCVQ